MKCDRKCFECKYDECIDTSEVSREKQNAYQAKYRAANRERFRENQNRWRTAHKEEVNRKTRERKLLKKHCDYCGAPLSGRDQIVKRCWTYFCTNQCLAGYLLKKSIDNYEVKTIIMPQPIKGGEGIG